jgi:organic radical activating enzyme
MCTKLGSKAKVLVDLGHHLKGVNIEQIIAILLDQNKLGGFHLNNHKYADDDLITGTVNPLEVFLIFNQIIDIILESSPDTVVVTGGEPLSYNLDLLCSELRKRNIKTFLETSGAYPLSGKWDWICLSPKKNSPPVGGIYSVSDELKVIIQTRDDFAWAEENAMEVREECKLFLQPEWSKYEDIIPDIVEYVKEHPRWSVSLQAHKFMHIP